MDYWVWWSEIKKKGDIAKELGISLPAVSQRINTISKRFAEGLSPVKKEQYNIPEVDFNGSI